MSAVQSANQQPSSGTWTEPPWSGWIETTGDALLILEAARRGLIPRVTRRLVDSERKMITSGSVFVFDEEESGIKRWTDGFFWSPSRILGNFLLYRETDKRGAGHRCGRSELDPTDQSQYHGDDAKFESQSLSRPKSDGSLSGVDKQRERTLVGSLTNSYKFKCDGLMKKTFSLTIGGVSQHLISYYKIHDVENGRLRPPSSLPELASLDVSPEYLDKTHFRNPPKVEYGPDGRPRYAGEADDIDMSPTLLTGPLSSEPPVVKGSHVGASSSGTSKRSKRYDPYGTPGGVSKRVGRKGKTLPSPDVLSSQVVSLSPQAPQESVLDEAKFHAAALGTQSPPFSGSAYYPVYHLLPSSICPPGAFMQGAFPQGASPIPPGQPLYLPHPIHPSAVTDPAQSGPHPLHFFPYYLPPHPNFLSYSTTRNWPQYSGYPLVPFRQNVQVNVEVEGSKTADGGENVTGKNK